MLTYKDADVLFHKHLHDVFGVSVVVSRKLSKLIAHLIVVHLRGIIGGKSFEELM